MGREIGSETVDDGGELAPCALNIEDERLTAEFSATERAKRDDGREIGRLREVNRVRG